MYRWGIGISLLWLLGMAPVWGQAGAFREEKGAFYLPDSTRKTKGSELRAFLKQNGAHNVRSLVDHSETLLVLCYITTGIGVYSAVDGAIRSGTDRGLAEEYTLSAGIGLGLGLVTYLGYDHLLKRAARRHISQQNAPSARWNLTPWGGYRQAGLSLHYRF